MNRLAGQLLEIAGPVAAHGGEIQLASSCSAGQRKKNNEHARERSSSPDLLD